MIYSKVKAIDGDGSSPNNELFYRIHSGAVDKFLVDPVTGKISVSPGANLDPDLVPSNVAVSRGSNQKSFSYILEISALDGGLGEAQRISLSIVNITILDVNNKAPYFESGLYSTPYHVLENSPIGFEIATVQANDQDISANLHYSIDNKISIARNELGVQMQMKGN